LPVFLFIIYIIAFSYFLTVIPFFKNSGIGRNTLIILFFIKIIAGVAYARFFSLPKYYTTSDTWKFYRYSIDETKWLVHNPVAFLKDLFIDNYSKSGDLFSGQNSYWNDLKTNVIIKLMAVVNVFTNNSYYTDIIFFDFLFLFGLAALFRVFIQIFPDKKWFIIAGIFLLPSTLFWGSGIHKDGLILSCQGLIIYAFFKGFKSTFTTRRILLIALCMLLIFSLRNYVFFALLPSLLAWWLCERYIGKSMKMFGLVYSAAIIFFIFLPFVFPSINIFSFIANKQHEFLLLEGGSKIDVPKLGTDAESFISFLPNALDMAFFRPHVTEVKNISYIPAIIENLLILLLLIVSVICYNKKIRTQPVIVCMFFFSISIMLLSGYTIPFTGAMVRYRSIVLPLLITPLLCISSFFSLHQKRPF
jgi:hypothetical protein